MSSATRARRVTGNAGRLATAPLRVLPDFLIVGAQRAGTTALYEHLGHHPQALPAFGKELHFFDLKHRRGPWWYRSRFPLARTVRRRSLRLDRPVVTGEASPYYLAHPRAAERAARLVPRARIIVLLRHPVDRAHSHWRLNVAAGHEDLDFEAAIAAEPDRLAGEAERLEAGRDLRRAPHQTWSYVTRGRYAEQLERWFAAYPRDQILVLQAEELFARPEAVIDDIVGFLGLAPVDLPPFAVRHARPGPPLEPDIRAHLDRMLALEHERLLAMIGIDYR